MRGKRRDNKEKRKEIKREIFKDDIRSLNGLKAEMNPCKNYRNLDRLKKPRQKLGIIPEGGEDSPQRKLLPLYGSHPNH